MSQAGRPLWGFVLLVLALPPGGMQVRDCLLCEKTFFVVVVVANLLG